MVIKAIQKAGIELEPEVAIKSSWKKEVKKRLDVFNEMEVRAESEAMRKGRMVLKGENGRTEYLNIPDKSSTGRHTQIFLDRQTTPVVKLWPTPDSAYTYSLIANTIQRIDDASASAQDPEVPSRFIPPMASGLAYYIALKKNPDKAGILKQQYEQDFKLASDEDRNRASLHLVPSRSYI